MRFHALLLLPMCLSSHQNGCAQRVVCIIAGIVEVLAWDIQHGKHIMQAPSIRVILPRLEDVLGVHLSHKILKLTHVNAEL